MRFISTQSAAGLLTLLNVRGVGAVTAERIAKRFSTFDEFTAASMRELCEIVPESVARTVLEPSTLIDAQDEARRILDTAEELDVHVLSLFDAQYPIRLKNIGDRPPVLYVKGRLDPLERNVACIGTREPSEFGVEVTRRIVEQLVGARWTIVSGLALGIDTIAHRAALDQNGRTVAVMAGGLDAIYPKQNAGLAEEILAQGGALVSEQSFGVPAMARHLVQRDRLQSGLSIATFVMQTDIRGGSMHTARFTLQQRRLLFAPVPQGRHALDEKSRGILAMTKLTGAALSERLQAHDDYKQLLECEFGDRPVAHSLQSRSDYVSMLEILERHCSDSSEQRRVSRNDLKEVEAQHSLF